MKLLVGLALILATILGFLINSLISAIAKRGRAHQTGFRQILEATQEGPYESRNAITQFEGCEISPGTSESGSALHTRPVRRAPTMPFFDPHASYAETLPGSASNGEKMCDEIIGACLGDSHKRYYNYRDSRISNADTGRALEFDFYVPSIGFAVEFDGSQHYVDSPHFNSSAREQMSRDHQKRTLASKYGITLVSIPHTYGRALVEFILTKEISKLTSGALGVPSVSSVSSSK